MMQKFNRNLRSFFKYCFRDYPHKSALWVIILVSLYTNLSLQYWKNPDRLLIWDVKSYYVYLPAVFIYHDLSLKFVERERDKIGDVMFLEEGPKGIYYNITTYGLSLLYSPFFLSAHAYATIANAEPTGYSPPYKFALMLSCVFYLALGLYFLLKLLMKYFPPWPTAITLIVIALGTNLYYYSTHEALMPHAYLFALISIFLYMGDRWYEKTDLKNSLILGFIIGLIILIRPVNIIILLLFILWGVLSWRSLITRILFLIKSYKWILLMILVTFMIWVPQFLYWKYISGNYLFYTYSDQRFFYVAGKT